MARSCLTNRDIPPKMLGLSRPSVRKEMHGPTSAAFFEMKILFATDLHGSEPHFARLTAVAGEVRPDVVVLGGDMLPDDSALDRANMGKGQPSWVRNQFRGIAAGIKSATGGIPILTVFGNHDWGSSVTAMNELAAEGLVEILDLTTPAIIDGVTFLGYSSTPPTPWFVKDFERLDMPGDSPPLLGGARWDARFNRPSMLSAETLFNTRSTMKEELADLTAPAGIWVWVAHCPPHASKLDQYHGNHSWGSKAVREALERLQPHLSLHGHIHESPSVTGAIRDAFGRTVAVNPGQTRSVLHYAVIDFDAADGTVGDVRHGQRA